MWAFCIWDAIKKQLFLARDRFGVKPLYFSVTPEYFAFSSEIKPLVYLNRDNFQINSDKIPFFILYGNRLNTEDTYINKVSSLLASHFLIYKDGNLSLKRYYDIKINEDIKNYSEEELQNQLVEILTDSIKLRFRSDVPVGTCLSGGFDSSSIVSLSPKSIENRLNTFSAVWQDKESDESMYIDIINKEYHCIEHKIEPNAEEFRSVFENLSYYQEIPSEGPGLYPQWYVMKAAKGRAKVLLDGQGGDEVFGGYFSKITYLLSILKNKDITKFIREFKHYSMFLNKRGIHSLSNWLFPRSYSKIIYGQISDKYKIFNPDIRKIIKKNGLYYDVEPPKKFKSYLNNLSYHFIMNLTIPTLLHYEDRSSMAFSIESRVPFLDYRVVEFGMNLPAKYLSYQNTSRPLFRKSIKPYLPTEIVNRKDKLGYPVPFAKWTRGILKEYVSDTLLNPDAMLYSYLDKSFVKSNLEMHFQGKTDYSWNIWRLLSLEMFMKQNYAK
jgi:asparagine synthase (glutamine-hydrolysing)